MSEYLSKDGQYYGSVPEWRAADKRYEQREERNDLLREQNRLSKELLEAQRKANEHQLDLEKQKLREIELEKETQRKLELAQKRLENNPYYQKEQQYMNLAEQYEGIDDNIYAYAIYNARRLYFYRTMEYNLGSIQYKDYDQNINYIELLEQFLKDLDILVEKSLNKMNEQNKKRSTRESIEKSLEYNKNKLNDLLFYKSVVDYQEHNKIEQPNDELNELINKSKINRLQLLKSFILSIIGLIPLTYITIQYFIIILAPCVILLALYAISCLIQSMSRNIVDKETLLKYKEQLEIKPHRIETIVFVNGSEEIIENKFSNTIEEVQHRIKELENQQKEYQLEDNIGNLFLSPEQVKEKEEIEKNFDYWS